MQSSSVVSSGSRIVALSRQEIDAVSGADAGLAPLGNLLYAFDYGINQILNTPLISSVGQTFNKFGLLGTAIHFTADSLGYLVFKDLELLAKGIGGSSVGSNLGPIPYHYATEWGLKG